MKRNIVTGALIAILVATILLSTGYVIVEQMTKMDPLPEDGFKILDKEERQGTQWFIPFTYYVFRYGEKEYSWLEVPQDMYEKYNIGDFYKEMIIVMR